MVGSRDAPVRKVRRSRVARSVRPIVSEFCWRRDARTAGASGLGSSPRLTDETCRAGEEVDQLTAEGLASDTIFRSKVEADGAGEGPFLEPGGRTSVVHGPSLETLESGLAIGRGRPVGAAGAMRAATGETISSSSLHEIPRARFTVSNLPMWSTWTSARS